MFWNNWILIFTNPKRAWDEKSVEATWPKIIINVILGYAILQVLVVAAQLFFPEILVSIPGGLGIFPGVNYLTNLTSTWWPLSAVINVAMHSFWTLIAFLFISKMFTKEKHGWDAFGVVYLLSLFAIPDAFLGFIGMVLSNKTIIGLLLASVLVILVFIVKYRIWKVAIASTKKGKV